MGKSRKGIRRKFGAAKAKEHFDRSKWTGTNGTRLRSLASDVVDYQEAKITMKEETAYMDDLLPLVLAQSEAIKPPSYSKYSTEELKVKKDHASRCISHLNKTLSNLNRMEGINSKLDAFVKRADERYKYKRDQWQARYKLMVAELETRSEEVRVRMTEGRMKELLAKGREIRLEVEKDIAEMRYIPPEHATQRCR